MVTYLHAATDNKSDTVLLAFYKSTGIHGMPSRVRTDLEGEMMGVKNFMEDVRGHDRGSFIAGQSVHNQRIERVWRDVWSWFANLYYDVFLQLQSSGILDADNEQQLWCLQYVFLPRIEAHCQNFKHKWNNHPLRTESNKTPNQLVMMCEFLQKVSTLRYKS